MEALERRVDVLERNASDQAKTLSVLTDRLGELIIDKAVRAERDKNADDRLERIEESITRNAADAVAGFKRINSLGLWLLAAFGSAIILAIANFIVNGGLHVGS